MSLQQHGPCLSGERRPYSNLPFCTAALKATKKTKQTQKHKRAMSATDKVMGRLWSTLLGSVPVEPSDIRTRLPVSGHNSPGCVPRLAGHFYISLLPWRVHWLFLSLFEPPCTRSITGPLPVGQQTCISGSRTHTVSPVVRMFLGSQGEQPMTSENNHLRP